MDTIKLIQFLHSEILGQNIAAAIGPRENMNAHEARAAAYKDVLQWIRENSQKDEEIAVSFSHEKKMVTMWREICDELRRGYKAGFDDFNSRHEGYAVLLEEVEELWQAIKTDMPTQYLDDEAVQVAAMAIKFLIYLHKEEMPCDSI